LDVDGGSDASLKLGMEPAVPPGWNDEVDPSKDTSGQQDTDDELEQEGGLLESLGVGGGENGGNPVGGGNRLFRGLGPLAEAHFVVPLVFFISIWESAGLLLFHWLVSVVDPALI
jgi:hypothetical protein